MFLSDRDNSVRNAALNCVVQAYHLSGDKIYKMVGNLNEKDLSMLDERIKRAKKNKPAVDSPPKPNTSVTTTRSEETGVLMEEEDVEVEEIAEKNEIAAPAFAPPYDFSHLTLYPILLVYLNSKFMGPSSNFSAVLVPPPKPKTAGPFGFDPNVVAEIEKGWVRSDKIVPPQLASVDLSFLRSPLKSAVINGVAYPTEKLQQLINRPQQHGSVLPAYVTKAQNIMPMSTQPQTESSKYVHLF